jgi:anti-anti-sigma factor
MRVTDKGEYDAPEAPEPGQFRIVTSEGVDGTLLVPHGELDLATAPELAAVLRSLADRRVIIDLRKLSFVDGRGLRVLLDADARSRQDGGNLRFIQGEAVRRLSELAQLPDALSCIEPPAR